MKALFLTKHLRVGGAQRLWTILLPGLRARGIDARVVTLEDQGEFFEELRSQGVPVACARMRGRLDLLALRPLLRGWRPDVVVSHDERSHLVARIVSRRGRAAQIACDYGSPGFPWRWHRALILRLVGPRLAAAVTVSAGRNPDLVLHGVPPQRIRVIPNGVDPQSFQPLRPRQDVRAELGLGNEHFAALLPAVLRPEKRPDRFVEALARAGAVEPRIRGLLAGYGPEADAIRRLASRLGAPVSVLGHRVDMPDVVAASDAVCLTSELEAVPYALLEAMALARPVLAMRVGALEEVVDDGVTGILVPPGDVGALADALVALARDPARALALGAAGRERQRARFDSSAMCDAYVRLLGDLVAARSSTLASAGAATPTE